MQHHSPTTLRRFAAACLIAGSLTVVACVGGFSGEVGDWWDGRGPVVPHATFPGDCALCHTAEDWHTLRADFAYDHQAETGVALNGAHSEAQCLRCHNDRGPVHTFSSQGCAGCHGDVHGGRLGDRCLDCHSEQDWQPSGQLAEHARTRFPLFGAHAAATCDRCHEGIGAGVFDPLSTECINCHQSDLVAAVSPDHQAEGWTQSCEECHRATTWSEEGFIHGFFPLTGGHATRCEDCHASNDFSPLPSDCAQCHLELFAQPDDPDHVALELPQDCERCHENVAWAPAGFDHSWVTRACADCHLDEFFTVQEPNHTLWGYSQNCEDCHNTEVWGQAAFDHAAQADGCEQCHLQDYLGTEDPKHQLWGYPRTCELCHHQFTSFPPADHRHEGVVDGCVGCHWQDYLTATEPDHAGLGFPLECQFCHIPDITWEIGAPGRDGRDFRRIQRPPVEGRAPAKGRRGGKVVD